MRRISLALLLGVTAIALAGCAGAGAQHADALLQQSDRALQGVKSFRFAGRLWLEGPEGQSLTFVLNGGGNAKHGGSSFVNLRADGVPGFPAVSVVTRGQTMWMRLGGAWTRSPLPAGQQTGMEQFDFSPYIKDVKVEEGSVVGGEPTAKITGVLDTPALLDGMLGQLGGVGGGSLPSFSQSFGDTRVVLYLSETTHLPLRALVDMNVEAAGERVDMHLDFAFEGFDKPVRIPNPGA